MLLNSNTDEIALVLFFGVLLLAGWIVDRSVSNRRVDWTNAVATQRDVATAIKGGNRNSPRHAIKLVLILIVAAVTFVVLSYAL